MLDIGDLPGGGILGYANGVSGDGSVVVGESWSGSGGTEAFYWTENDGMVGLGNLSGRSFGGFFSSAFGISADGLTIVGDSQSPDGNDHVAFRWTKSDGMISLGYLPGGSASYARAISANGSVIVGFGSGYEAFRWTQHTGMVGLGTLPDGFSSYAKAASADGSVVVGMSNTTSGDKLFIWDSLSGMRNLSDVLSNELGLGDSLSGWSLQNVTGISSDGLTIVGYGINPMGRQEAWMARLQGLRATAGGPYLVALGNAIQLNGKCILPDTNETPSFLWAPAEHLDDATLSSPTYTTHALTTPSIEALTLTCEDSEHNSDADSTIVVVYDPNGGFVTGSGWIYSPEGACHYQTCAYNTTGKANFGFVSKYKKGAQRPTGQTEFHFKAGDLNFHSDSYDWLVVAGAHAKFKGVGTINGGGNYGFMVTATDGQFNGGHRNDGFRIKIWDTAMDNAIVYDNQSGESDDSEATTVLGGGNIMIHYE
jgi:probable HAF family extracellular repeat protein